MEELNRKALKMAREVADQTGTLMGGNICNTAVYNPKYEKSKEVVEAIFKVGLLLRI